EEGGKQRRRMTGNTSNRRVELLGKTIAVGWRASSSLRRSLSGPPGTCSSPGGVVFGDSRRDSIGVLMAEDSGCLKKTGGFWLREAKIRGLRRSSGVDSRYPRIALSKDR
ncbi:hypothetical protein OTU49_009889, partial [Cherax quadricarinatus]